MGNSEYVVGVDFGTDSVRTLVVDASNGAALSVSVKGYSRWAKGLYCDPQSNRFRQHPLDYLESMEASIRAALAAAGRDVASKIRGIAVDTTGSTPVLADRAGRPLALTAGFEDNPNAMFILWKDHTAVAEAERINYVARTWEGVDYTRFTGGVYSSEWFWAKAIHALEVDAAVAKSAVTILEHCDWIPAVLTGVEDVTKIKRSRCAAGHKALWHAEFGGYPPDEFFAKLNPNLPALKATLGTKTYTSDTPFGVVCETWAARLGVPRNTVVAVGAFDAHMGAVGGGVGPRRLLKVIGTSTCDIVVVPKTDEPETLVPGICGQVNGSVLPGAIGYEAGQSAFGDVYAWFKKLLLWPLDAVLPLVADGNPATVALRDAIADKIIPELEKAAMAVPAEEAPTLAVDWMNGRRTPDADQRVKGAITGISLGTDAPRIFRSLVLATAFGSRAIVERFRSSGIRIDSVIAIGGVAKKSRFVMQTLADVLNMEVAGCAGEQAVALGAAMFAATAAGIYAKVEDAQAAMSPGSEVTYRPNPEQKKIYDRLYAQYTSTCAFVNNQLKEQSYSGCCVVERSNCSDDRHD